jgi:hypothetical protein
MDDAIECAGVARVSRRPRSASYCGRLAAERPHAGIIAAIPLSAND